ncbi:hypothetical protein ACS0TY_032411 [Phlomoides rotata]
MECKLCDRKFSNGKALGGHMRSHFAALPLPPKTPQRQELSEPLTDSTSSIFSSDERESSGDKSSLLSGSYGLREKPKKSIRLADPDFCDSVVDRQSESGSTRARCKRGRGKGMEDDQEVTKKGIPASEAPLMSELEMEEDVATCLVMLSRDVWRASEEELQMREKIYKCEGCDRVFKSTQGLGSHRANHHQNKVKKSSDDGIRDNEFSRLENHECEFCGKVFRSGKALGGHKRVHLTASKLGTSSVEGHSPIDLNLPPEIENEEFHSSSCPSFLSHRGDRKW